jgi:hypothetical protein
MVKLAECIVEIIIDEYGLGGFLRRVSDPWFFQSLSCTLGYDWHSSGTTTVTCGALKEAIDPASSGIAVAGGKGKTSRKAPLEIHKNSEILGLGTSVGEKLIYASKMSAKVDNSLIQDGYQLYHHTFIFSEKGEWAVIQQGINEDRGNARRYHWSPDCDNFITDPQTAIQCETSLENVLDMTHLKSEKNQKLCLDLVKENPLKLKNMLTQPIHKTQTRIDKWIKDDKHRILVMPRRINWNNLRRIYEFQPKNYEELIALRGVGPSTIRGLALVAELIYGESPSWRDPVRFTFAFGGKDGVPFPVDRKGMDKAVEVLKSGIFSSKVRREDKQRAIERLRRCVPNIPNYRL